MCLGIVECLIGAVDRFTVNAQPVFGVVLHLDGQVSVDAFDEDLIFDRDVRVCTLSMVVACGSLPLELVLGRLADFRFTSVVDVLKGFILHDPLEGLEIARSLSGLEDYIEIRADADESREGRVAIVSIEFLKIS